MIRRWEQRSRAGVTTAAVVAVGAEGAHRVLGAWAAVVARVVPGVAARVVATVVDLDLPELDLRQLLQRRPHKQEDRDEDAHRARSPTEELGEELRRRDGQAADDSQARAAVVAAAEEAAREGAPVPGVIDAFVGGGATKSLAPHARRRCGRDDAALVGGTRQLLAPRACLR